MQCTSNYIGYLHYNIIVGCRDDQRFLYFPAEGLLLSTLVLSLPHSLMAVSKIFADQLHRVTDRPHKVNDLPHEVTD